jgi:hypothetical protein
MIDFAQPIGIVSFCLDIDFKEFGNGARLNNYNARCDYYLHNRTSFTLLRDIFIISFNGLLTPVFRF